MKASIIRKASLREILADFESLTTEDTICAEGRPNWTPDSRARVLRIPEYTEFREIGPIPDYFIEVMVAKDALEGWSEVHGGRKPTVDEVCELLIYYAQHDGFSAEQLGQ